MYVVFSRESSNAKRPKPVRMVYGGGEVRKKLYNGGGTQDFIDDSPVQISESSPIPNPAPMTPSFRDIYGDGDEDRSKMFSVDKSLVRKRAGMDQFQSLF